MIEKIEQVKNMSSYYILENNSPKAIDNIEEWAMWMEENKVLLHTIHNGFLVSTVFLGIDHGFSFTDDSKPVLFETMIFGPDGLAEFDNYQTRCSTYDETIEQHFEGVKFLIRQLEYKRKS